ncbi:hypothetical protein D9611_000684 [Ephemerocybe angulata]|uniref:Uncharacterized protein n=1 Tax=Ephemerocybe angulata TaxID=980116 RepID=A0A8H5BM68_9AGAR|nr:hypothetical protein D9611_000684 [Tulosesus angulatus]
MADSELSPASTDSGGRGRGRGKSRGGLGKYLRARGRGHRGGGRPAVFRERLLLEGEGPLNDEEAELAAEKAAKYSRRQMGTNADRYVEPEPELDSDGEPIVEPEVDLSSFLEKQKISDTTVVVGSEVKKFEEDEVDQSLSHITSNPTKNTADRKGKVQEIQWDRELEEMSRAKAAAEAQRDLKARFKAKSEKLKGKPVFKSTRERQAEKYELAPELPSADGAAPKPSDTKVAMEDYLDDLLG